MPEAFIGLGSNLCGESDGLHKTPKMQIECAIDKINSHKKISIQRVSSLYQTPAIGPGDQPDYINAAAKIEADIGAYELLDALQSIEHQQGRIRQQRWGARTLDLDLLMYDQLIEDTAKLTLPHPRAHERAFVLAPLADLNPDLIIPNHGRVIDLLANCSMQGIVKLSN
ncbi:MAG: 2-amino-4-hydroxy-6-hydroxymethyldihydropteridine diphosphokinase [Porticoccaceae bacterium]|jgi:2-amino-4-hydroxy-6-hydroxymethyldihydropteridine diphosphokinase